MANVNKYFNFNDTTRLLAQQRLPGTLNKESSRKQLRELREAAAKCGQADAFIDFYILGYIHGKQAERERRHKQ